VSALCLRAVRACALDLTSRLPGAEQKRSSRRLALDDFELWRPRVATWLLIATSLLVAYWVLWSLDLSLLASAHTANYVSFEQAFPLADAWLATAALIGAVQLRRRRPSAFLWLVVVGGAGIYLCALDVLYDIQHGLYANGNGGAIEFCINAITVLSSVGVLNFAWRFRDQLLGASS
jgi:hypothetical protein